MERNEPEQGSTSNKKFVELGDFGRAGYILGIHMRMFLRWLTSKTVRQAYETRKQVWTILNSQRDILGEKAVAEVSHVLREFKEEIFRAETREDVIRLREKLEDATARWLKPYPFPSARENIKEFLVTGVFILSIFTFFVQPMKIPSGSAQPTLYGNVVTDLKSQPDTKIPGLLGRFRDWFKGIDYHYWVTKEDGVLEIEPVRTVARFIKIQRFRIGKDTYTFYWPPEHLERLCGARAGQPFKRGEIVLKLRISSGDRLLVDKFTYNFRRPRRGEIIVFASTGIPGLIQHTHYIKRLIAMGGERVKIGDDRHVYINGRRLDHTDRHFEFVYSFNGPPRESVYSGHVNDKIGMQYSGRSLAPLFPDGNAEFVVRPNHYLAFGDNTMNSFDGRVFGDFPREKVVGRACFVFWPLTSRFGLIYY
ncbi:MAG: signal peptidase I [Verrucomicrobiae bacterium]|nr:signal peptidase I [Verrucomicrobiae bacterium]